MRNITPDDAARKWSERFAGSADAYSKGILGIRDNPLIGAADNRQKWLTNVQAAASKWESKLRAYSFDKWKSRTSVMGAQNLGIGAQKGLDKYRSFMTRWIPFVQGVLQQNPKTPNSTFEQRLARMTAIIRAFHGFRTGQQEATGVGQF